MIDIYYRINKELASWIAIWYFLRGLDRDELSFTRTLMDRPTREEVCDASQDLGEHIEGAHYEHPISHLSAQ